jgi:hypothetical protein
MSVNFMTVLIICFGFSQVWAESETEKIALSTAQAWLSTIDNRNYLGSWKETSTDVRGAVTEQSWVASLEAVCKPLGKLVSRKIVKAQESNSLPGAPNGRYVVMLFKTAFEQKKSVVETATFMLDNDKKWRTAGYFIK